MSGPQQGAPATSMAGGAGRGRARRLVRIALVAIGVVAVLLVALVIGIHTPAAKRFALRKLTEVLAAQQIDLRAASLDYNLLALSVSLDNVVVASRTAVDAPPVARAARVSLNLGLADLLVGRYVVQDGVLVEPQVHVLVDEQGRDNLPHAAAAEPPADEPSSPTELPDYLIEHFALSNGQVRYEDRGQGLDAMLPVTSITVEGTRATREHLVRLATGAGYVHLRDRAIDIDQFGGELTVDRDALAVRHLDLGAGGSTLTLTGQLASFADPHADLSLTARLDVARLAALAGTTEPVGGLVDATVHATGPLAGLAITTDVRGRDLRYRNLDRAQLSAAMAYDAGARRAEVSHLELDTPAGSVRGDAAVALEPGAGDSRATLSVPGLDLLPLAEALDLPYRAATVAHVDAHVQWPDLDYARAQGTASLRLEPTRPRPAAGVVPLAGTVVATAQGDTVHLDVQGLRGLGAAIDGKVALADRERLDGTVRARAADVAQVIAGAEALLGRPRGTLVGTPLAGALDVRTRLSGTLDAPTADFTVAAPSLSAGELTGIDVDLAGRYTPDAVLLSRGDVAWDEAAIHASGRVALGDTPTMDVHAVAENIRIPAALAAAGQSEVPADGVVALQAAVSGPVSQPRGRVHVQAADLAAYGERFGTLSLDAALDGRRAELSTLRLDKPQDSGDASLEARGTYDLDRQLYTLSLATRDLRLTSLTLPDGRVVTGGVDVAADASGTLADPGGTARIAVTDLQLDDQWFGDLRVDATVAEHQAVVRGAADAFKLAADARIATDAPYAATADVRVDDLDLSTLPVQLDPALGGVVAVRLNGAGDLENPAGAQATATIERLGLQWNEQPIDLDGPAVLRYADRQVAIDWLRVRTRGSAVSLYGTLPLDADAEGAINIDVQADLADAGTYAPPDLGLTASGSLALTGAVRGSLARIDPALTLTVTDGSVTLPALEQPVANIAVRAEVADGVLRLSELGADWGAAHLAASGGVPFGWLPEGLPVELPRPGGAAEVHAALTGLDLAALPGAPADLTGGISLEADVSAPRPDVAALTGQLTFPELWFAFGSLTLGQQDPSTVALAGGQVDIQRFALAGTAGKVNLAGRAGLTGERPVDAKLDADLNLAAVSSLTSGVRTGGRAALGVTAAGTVADPAVTGFVEVTNARFAIEQPQVAAQEVNLRVDATPERIALSRLDGSLNGGTITGSGSVNLSGTTFSDLNVTLSAADVALEAPLNLRSVSKADIRVTQAESRSGEGEVVVGGQVTIDEAGLTDDINLDTGALQALTSPPPLELTESRNPLLERVRFDLKVNTATPIVVDNNLARAEITADLRVLGTPYETGMSGRLDIAEGSELILNERRYQVQRGGVTFIDDRSIRPSLDLELTTTARKYDITIAASGTPDDTTTSLTSSPTLPEPDIMALLVTGRTLDEMRGDEIDVAKSQVMSYLGGRAGSQIGRGLQRATGLSTVRVEPNLIATETDPGARLTVGQDLTQDLSLVYSTDLVNSSDNIWVAEYDVTRQFTTRAVRQSDATYRFDFRHDVQFGGTPEPARTKRPRQNVGTVTVTGRPVLPESEILARFKLRTGKKYDFFRLREATERVLDLYRDRDYLQARVRVDRAAHGQVVDLTLRVVAGPQVTLAFTGDAAGKDFAKAARVIWSRGVFDTQRADDVRDMIREKLVAHGYVHPTIDYDLGTPGGTRRQVTFRVDRGVHFDKVRLLFEGAGGVDPRELEGVIHEQKLGPKVFTDPVTVTELLRRFYGERGFLTAKLEKPEYEFDEAARQARVRIAVQEGPLFSIRSITAEGNRAYDTAALLRELPLVVGDPFYPSTADQALIRIRQLYWARGYNDVRPAYTLSIDRDNGILDAHFTIEEGPRSVVASIGVAGTEHTSDRLVRDEMEIEKGKPLDLSALGKSRQNLYGTRAFSLVDITRAAQDDGTAGAAGEASKPGEAEKADAAAQPVDAAQAAGRKPEADGQDQLVDVNVAVREVQPFQVRYGVLFDTERGPGGILDVSNHNSLGHARVLGLQSRYDSQVREARLYLNQPSLRPQPVETIMQGYYRDERNPATSRADAFNVDRMGVMIQQERRFKNQYVWSYGYRFERARTYEPGLTGPLPPFVNVAPLTSTISRETRDEPLDAARGSFLSHAFSFSPSFLGSEVPFIKYFGQYFHYVPLRPPTRKRFTNEILRPRLVYAVGVRLGLARGIGGEPVPLSERFLAGGSTTLRGFEQNAVGPIGADGVPLGGEGMFVVNNELRFPLVGIVDGVVFADVGNVFQSVRDFSFTDLRESGGFGVRVRTPWLLVRMDYGFPFDRRTGEPRSRFFFSIGQAF